MGESTQEKNAKKVYQSQGDAISGIKGEDLTLGDYRSFSSDDMLGNLNNTYNTGIDRINKSFGSDISRSERNAGERMASQGLSKGSLFNNTVASAGDGLKGEKYNAIGGLTMDKGNAELNVMDSVNRMDQGDAQFNSMAKLRKYTAILDGLNSQLGSVGMMDSTNGWDDALATLNVGSNVAKGVASIPGI